MKWAGFYKGKKSGRSSSRGSQSSKGSKRRDTNNGKGQTKPTTTVRNIKNVETTDHDNIPAMINVHPIDDALHLSAEETVERDEVVSVHQRIVLLVWKIGQKK